MFLLVSIMDPWTKQTHQLPTELSLKISPPTKSEKNHLQGKWWTLGSSLTSLSGERGIHWKIWTHCRTIFFRTSNQKKMGSTVGIPLNVSKWTCKNSWTIWRMRRCVSFPWFLDTSWNKEMFEVRFQPTLTIKWTIATKQWSGASTDSHLFNWFLHHGGY